MDIHKQYQVNEQTLHCFPNLKEEAIYMADIYNEGHLSHKLNLKSEESDNETIGLTDYGDDISEDGLSTIAASSSHINFRNLNHYGSMTSLTSNETTTTYSEIFGKKKTSKWKEEHDILIPECISNPYKFEDPSLLNKGFDWNGWVCGVVVEQIRNPSKMIVCYKIWPFCNGETTAIELFLDTDEKREILDLGQWIKFERKDLFPSVVNPDTYQKQAEMFKTIPALGGMECQIVIHLDRRREICTKLKRWLTNLQMSNCMTRTPFIRRVRDDLGLIRPEDLGTTRWATLEYIKIDDCGEEGCWRLVFIRPQYYGEGVSN